MAFWHLKTNSVILVGKNALVRRLAPIDLHTCPPGMKKIISTGRYGCLPRIYGKKKKKPSPIFYAKWAIFLDYCFTGGFKKKA